MMKTKIPCKIVTLISSNGRRHICHDPEVEHEQMHGDQWHDQAVLLAQCHDDRGQKRGDHDIVRGGGQAHAQDQAQHSGQHKNGHDIATRKHLDHIGQGRADTRLADSAQNAERPGDRRSTINAHTSTTTGRM